MLYSRVAVKRALKMSETAHAKLDTESFCQYCGGRLHLGYHFSCHVCGDSYCYIHMSRHARAHSRQPVPQRVCVE